MFNGVKITGTATSPIRKDVPPCVTIHSRGEGRFTSSIFRAYPDIINGGVINIEWDKKLMMLRFNFNSGSCFSNSSFNVIPAVAKDIIKATTKIPLVPITNAVKTTFLITHRDDIYWYAKPCNDSYQLRQHFGFEHLTNEEQLFWMNH